MQKLLWPRSPTTVAQERLDHLDVSIEAFCDAHPPTRVDQAGKLYLVLSLHTFADLCRKLEPRWAMLDRRDQLSFNAAVSGVAGLLAGFGPGPSVQWYAFVSCPLFAPE